MSLLRSVIPLSILVLLHAPKAFAEKAKTVVVDKWYDGFKGLITLDLTDDVTSGWTLTLSFPVPTPNLEIWRAEIVDNQGDKVYTMKNMPWNTQMSKGTFKLYFIAKKSDVTKDPPIGAVMFSRGAPITNQPPTASPSPPPPVTKPPSSSPGPDTTRPTQPPQTTAPPSLTQSPSRGPGKYDYSEVLKLSILFYEAQRSGKLPPNNRVKWRKDSALGDKGPNGEDLTGGWYDAGDYVKFGFPMASSVTVLAWGIVEYKEAYVAAGQYSNVLNSIKWATDYFIKAHTKKEEFYGQVGDGDLDHAFWGRPEDMTMRRPAWKITPQNPGSDLAAETAAALAAASIAFKAQNTRASKKYARKLLTHSKQLYAFADKYRGVYSDSIPNAGKFYKSYSGFQDELVWGAAWLYRATKESSYLVKAEKYYKDYGMDGQAWAFSWDDKKAGVQLLLAQLTRKESYKNAIKASLDNWLPGGSVRYTPKGLAWRIKWGSNRYAANTAFLALVAADQGLKRTAYRNFAKKQINYVLGDSGRSFVVGFGKNPPRRPHHSSSSCPSAPQPCGWDNFNADIPNAHVLKGALVGGPDENDNYKDDRKDYVMNEVTTDYNAGFQSSVAACLLFFLLFARHTCAEQSRITVVNEWNTGFTAKFTFRLQSKVTDGWIITLTFSKPALKLQTWIGDIKSVSPDRKRYVITNKPWQKQLNAGYELSTEIVLTKPVANSPAPGGVALFQRLGAGAGGGAGGGNTGGGGGGHTGGGGGVIAKPTAPPAPGPFNYNEVLRKSILFYEAQRAGRLPATNRIPWRKSATLRDGADVGVDLSGGWFDAGDFVKFGFPMASSVTVLTWGLLKYKEAYIAAGELKSMLDCIKWPLDYFMKAHTSKFELYVQVGDGVKDHEYWGRPEDMHMARPALKITAQRPGSDVAAETAAALAAGAIAFRKSNPSYSNQLLAHAKGIYEFARTYLGKYSDSIPRAAKFYKSGGYKDELVWGAAWLYRATRDRKYLTLAESLYKKYYLSSSWAFSWDDKTAAVQMLLYGLTKKPQYKLAIQKYLANWLPGGSLKRTPKGLVFRDAWGANRFAANTAFLALLAADQGLNPTTYRQFARKQIHYMLGDSGRSYVVGFGKNPPQRPHHRSSSCPSAPARCDWGNYHNSGPNAHVLHGALVGGPDRYDNFKDDRTEVKYSEVATDYNAGFQSAVAGLRRLQ
ncbi:hypothetical protein pdam_00011347, partial [Pocillopora damicornis]